tara:strand:- start:1297 stop:1671 length:375 start_codon:yes stop_codon:yes gene_type:complete
MEIKINVRKKHFYLLSLLIVLVGGILFVQGQGGFTFGHAGDDVSVVIDGAEKNLQDAVDGGDIGSDNVAVIYQDTSYHVQVDGSSGAFKCPDGEVLVGINYKNGGDDHMVGMYCAPLEYTEYIS